MAHVTTIFTAIHYIPSNFYIYACQGHPIVGMKKKLLSNQKKKKKTLLQCSLAVS